MSSNLTTKMESDLNRANKASQNATLGTRLKGAEDDIDDLETNYIYRGKATVSSAQATANAVDIVTGLAAVSAYIVQIYKSGVDVKADAVMSQPAAGTLRIADGSTYSVTEGDVISWIAW